MGRLDRLAAMDTTIATGSRLEHSASVMSRSPRSQGPLFATRSSLLCWLPVLLAACSPSPRDAPPSPRSTPAATETGPNAARPGPAEARTAPGVPVEREALWRALDAVGPLESDRYDPGPVIQAINALQPLGRERGTAALADYLQARGPQHVYDRGGLFAVLRVLYQPPSASPPWPDLACTPRQRDLVSGPCLRPPLLGAPQPPPPEDLRSLRFPFMVLGDVPLSLVSGYHLAGKAEPVGMHFDALSSANTGWLEAQLQPKSAGEIRYLFTHYGQWSANGEVGRGIEKQLSRL